MLEDEPQKATPTNGMNKRQKSNTKQSEKQETAKVELIKLSLDVHAKDLVVVRQFDNAVPQPPQRMATEAFISWAAKQIQKAPSVKACYEAGPTGFWLARRLIELGIECTVVRPCRLDAYGKRVKNDRTDALALAERFDRFVAGNPKAVARVRIPSVQEEQKRAESRQRGQFHRMRQQAAAMGRSLLLLHGVRCTGTWWQGKKWEELQEQLEEELIQRLIPLQETVIFMSQQLTKADKSLDQAGSSQPRPKGAGAKTLEMIDREICCWDRFKNRKQIGSYSGLCGGIEASGGHHSDLPITKAGNRRLRTLLVEMAWRMVYWQSQSPLIQRWRHVLLNPKAHTRGRKRAIIAVARRLLVDLWRLRTGRMSLQDLGWIPMN